jgi:hypothetical protein
MGDYPVQPCASDHGAEDVVPGLGFIITALGNMQPSQQMC